MDVSDIIAMVRIVLLIAAIIITLKLYHRLPFKGFLTLSLGFGVRMLTVILIELHMIVATETIAEILLMMVSVLFTISVYMLYRAQKEFMEGLTQ